MIYVISALCAVVTTFFICRYYSAKCLIVEGDIQKTIARKVASNDKLIELAKLREENAVMRNLLLDLLENEASFPVQQSRASQDDFLRVKAAKIQRYREILAESQYVLQQHESSIAVENFGQTSRASAIKPSPR